MERFVDNQWTNINDSETDTNFELGLHTLKPLSSVEILYLVSVYSSFNEVGEYRIVIQAKSGKDVFTIYCPFTVK